MLLRGPMQDRPLLVPGPWVVERLKDRLHVDTEAAR